MSKGTITGAGFESQGRVLHIASNGDLFFISSAFGSTTISVYRSTNGGTTWGSAVSTTAGRTLSAISGVTFGTDLIAVAWNSSQYTSGMDVGTDVEYQEFNMATNAWSGSVDSVGFFVTALASQTVGIVARTSDRVIIHPGSHSDMGNDFKSLFIARGTSGSWTTDIRLDDVNGDDNSYGMAVVGSVAGDAHLIWGKDTGTELEGRTLRAANTLSTIVTLTTTIGSRNLYAQHIISWDDSGTQRIVLTQNAGSIRAGEDGSDDLAQDETGFTAFIDGESAGRAALAVDEANNELYAIFPDNTDFDLHSDQTTGGAAGDWGTDVELQDAVTVSNLRTDAKYFVHSSGNGGATVIGYVFDIDGTGDIRYDEIVLIAGSAPSPVFLHRPPRHVRM